MLLSNNPDSEYLEAVGSLFTETLVGVDKSIRRLFIALDEVFWGYGAFLFRILAFIHNCGIDGPPPATLPLA